MERRHPLDPDNPQHVAYLAIVDREGAAIRDVLALYGVDLTRPEQSHAICSALSILAPVIALGDSDLILHRYNTLVSAAKMAPVVAT